MTLAWIDLETSGTSENKDVILEVGLIVTTNRLEELVRNSWVVSHKDVGWLIDIADPVVQQMHHDNGLWLAVEASKRTIAEVDEAVAATIDRHTNGGRVTLAGSGVGHFDMRFIRAHMPKTSELLRYYVIDVGVIRRFLRDCCRAKYPEPPVKPHRALDDIALHLDEARRFQAIFADIDFVGEPESDT